MLFLDQIVAGLFLSSVSLLGQGPRFFVLFLPAASNMFPKTRRSNDALNSEPLAHMMLSVPCGNYCEHLQKCVGGSGGKVI